VGGDGVGVCIMCQDNKRFSANSAPGHFGIGRFKEVSWLDGFLVRVRAADSVRRVKRIA